MGDPISMLAIGGVAASMIGSGISAYGQYQAGQAQSMQLLYKANTDAQLAAAAKQNAIWDTESGEVKAQQAGLASAATVGRETAAAGARNVAISTGSTANVTRSQIAIGQENQSIIRADAAHAAYGEEIQAASLTAQSNLERMTAGSAVTSGEIAAAGTLVSGAGTVANKWYGLSSSGGFGTPSTPVNVAALAANQPNTQVIGAGTSTESG